MPRKKKAPPELQKTFIDDGGVEREYNKPYVEKFLYQGNPHVFMVVQQQNGHIFTVRCGRDVLTALREAFEEAARMLAEKRAQDE